MAQNHTPPSITVFFNAFDACIAKLEGFMMAAGIILIAINTMANATSRFLFDHSIIFAEELNSSFIVLVTFAGIGYAARHNRHIRMSAIYDSMTWRIKKILMMIIAVITALLMFFLAYYSVQYIVSIYSRGRIMPALGIPVYVIYLWVPIGFFMTGIQYALMAVKNIKSNSIYLSATMTEHDVENEGRK